MAEEKESGGLGPGWLRGAATVTLVAHLQTAFMGKSNAKGIEPTCIWGLLFEEPKRSS